MALAMAKLEESDIEYAVKNTFIEYPARRSLSLEGFLQERETKSCPGSKVSHSSEITVQRLKSLEEDFPSFWETPKHGEKSRRLNAKADYIVKNTFIEQEVDFPVLRTLSLEEFLKERETKSCPGSGVMHRLESSQAEPALLDLPKPFPGAPVQLPVVAAERFSVETEQSLAQAFVQRLESLEEEPTLPETPIPFPATPDHFPAVPIEELSMEGLLQTNRNFTGHPGVLEQRSAPHFDRSLATLADQGAQIAQALEVEGTAEDPLVLNLSNRLSVWSAGSIGHEAGYCKPCAFLWKDGCKDGAACDFCHLCPPGEQKRRKREKHTWRKAVRAARVGLRFGGMF